MARPKSNIRKSQATKKKKSPTKKSVGSGRKTGIRAGKKGKVAAKSKASPARRPRNKSRRDGVKYPGLEGRFFSRVKQEYHDIDYAHKLNEKEKAWMNSFMEEDLGANFDHRGKKIYKNSNPKRKASYRRNNYRNLDMYGQAKVQGKVVDTKIEDALDEHFETDLIESINRRQEAAIEEKRFLSMGSKRPSGKARKSR